MDIKLATAKSNELNMPTHLGEPLYPSNYDSLHRGDGRPAAGEYALSPSDYARFRVFVLERIGLDYPEDKRAMLGRGLASVMNLIGCADFDELYRRLSSLPTSSVLWDQVISVLTIGETYFFRNTSHFDALTKNILPALMVEREHTNRRIRIWSAGCATGEEPYSLAILMKETIPDLERWNILILATDLNRDALHKAQVGRYGAWSFRGVEKRVQETYFRLDQNQYVIADDIKSMVTFDYLNLVADPFPSLTNNTNAMDVLMCRNVTIYFNEPVTRSVILKFHASVVDGGWLIPGPSEPNLLYYGDFQTRNFPGTVVYQKSAALKPAPVFNPAVAFPRPVSPPPTVSAPQRTAPAFPKAPPPDPYHQALDYMRAERTDEALKKLYEKIAKEPSFAPAYVALGKIYANLGNLEEAQQYCERAIQFDKLHPEPYYTLSMIYQQHGLHDQAVDVLKKTIYLDRQFVLAHYNLAQIYYHQNEPVLARRSLQNAQRLLEGKTREDLVPEGDGLIVGRLLELIASQLAEPVI